MKHDLINPASLGAPKGYSNGVLAKPGRMLFVAGQIAWGPEQKIVSADFGEQFAQALANVMVVVQESGGTAEDICRLTVYLTDKRAYLAALKAVGAAYRQHMGRHYPAMAFVEVRALMEDEAQVEIEATAVL